MRRLEPFKVRKGGLGEAMETASRLFGHPTEVSQKQGHCEMRWHFYDDLLLEYGLDMGFHKDSELVSMTIQVTNTATDQTLFGPVLTGKNTQKRIEEFVEAAKKPWEEWSEAEIMEAPMWVHLYRRDGNEPTPAMENMMAMLSFQSPDNIWVKKYFGGKE